MPAEKRLVPRQSMALPVLLDDATHGVTRDISPAGMYIEISGDHLVSGTLYFEMDLGGEARMKFTAQGQVVRIEHREGRTGIALRLISPKLESTD